MDENQEIIIRSVLRPQASQTFTQVNLQAAFLQASLNADQIKDQKDKTILNNFFQGSAGPHASTTTSQVPGDRERPPTQQSSAPFMVDTVLLVNRLRREHRYRFEEVSRSLFHRE